MSRSLDRMRSHKDPQTKLAGVFSTVHPIDKTNDLTPDLLIDAISTPNKHTLTPQAVLQLQQTHGNRYVQRLIQRARHSETSVNRPKEEDDLQITDPSAPASIASNSATAVGTPKTGIIQRTWYDLPLDYQTINKEKKSAQIRTGKVKFNSIEDWVKKFRSAIASKKPKEALKALQGLIGRLRSDAEDASKGKLKPPKGVKTKDFDKTAAQLVAAQFFQKWIQATQEHIDHLNTSTTSLGDFFSFYMGESTNTTDLVDLTGEGSSSGKTEIKLDPRTIFLNNVEQLEDIKSQELEAMPHLWDKSDITMQQRLAGVMGGDPELKRVNRVPYFLEAVSPIHVGYETVRNIFNFWATGVLYHGWEKSYADWMPTQLDNPSHGTAKIVPYFGADKRGEYRLTFSGKQVLKADGKPLVGDSIYVVGGDDVFYGDPSGGLHHTSFLEGMPVKCAGHLTTDSSGNLKSINDNSGHYEPNKDNLKRALVALKSQMDTSEVSVGSYTGKGGGTSIDDFLKS